MTGRQDLEEDLPSLFRSRRTGSFSLQGFGATHIGRRKANEDAFVCREDLGLFVVADGLGGMGGGDVASRLVVDWLVAHHGSITEVEEAWLREDPSLLLRAAIGRAHDAVVAQQEGERASMASTVAALAVRGEYAVIAHAGDSRVYRLRGEMLERLTEDHSFHALDIELGLISERERHAVTRALGVTGVHHPDVRTEDLRSSDVFLLSSDGLTNSVGDDELFRILSALPASLAPRALITRALELGARDNITAVVVTVGGLSTDGSSR